jgi:hypothetical protein
MKKKVKITKKANKVTQKCTWKSNDDADVGENEDKTESLNLFWRIMRKDKTRQRSETSWATFQIQVRNVAEDRDHLEELGADRNILQWILGK